MTDRFWHGRSVLVTGATGFIGSWLVKALLEKGARVTALVLDADPQSEFVRSGDVTRCHVVNGSLADFSAVERAINTRDVDTVFHLGAQALVGVAHRFPLPTFESNIRGTYNLLEACRVHGSLVSRVVVASSDKAYGHTDTLPYVETSPLAGRHPYEVSKTCTDLLAQTYAATYDLPLVVARFGNVFGGGDLNFSRLVPDAIRSCLAGVPFVIRSDGTFKRDYVFVRDVVDGYLAAAERLEEPGVRGEAFNFSGEKPRTVIEVVRAIHALVPGRHPEPDVRNDAVGEIRDQYLSADKARDRLGWTPATNFEAGLRETIAWYRRYLA